MPIKRRTTVPPLPGNFPHKLKALHRPDGLVDIVWKDQWHREGKRVLRALAAEMGLPKVGFQVRSNLGGPAVTGEIILHSYFVYVMITHDIPWSAEGPVMYRSVKGLTDYTGGNNNWMPISAFDDLKGLAARLNRMNRSNL